MLASPNIWLWSCKDGGDGERIKPCEDLPQDWLESKKGKGYGEDENLLL